MQIIDPNKKEPAPGGNINNASLDIKCIWVSLLHSMTALGLSPLATDDKEEMSKLINDLVVFCEELSKWDKKAKEEYILEAMKNGGHKIIT